MPDDNLGRSGDGRGSDERSSDEPDERELPAALAFLADRDAFLRRFILAQVLAPPPSLARHAPRPGRRRR
jgi:hypothetical protein